MQVPQPIQTQQVRSISNFWNKLSNFQKHCKQLHPYVLYNVKFSYKFTLRFNDFAISFYSLKQKSSMESESILSSSLLFGQSQYKIHQFTYNRQIYISYPFQYHYYQCKNNRESDGRTDPSCHSVHKIVPYPFVRMINKEHIVKCTHFLDLFRYSFDGRFYSRGNICTIFFIFRTFRQLLLSFLL